jgi:hypothetical protein
MKDILGHGDITIEKAKELFCDLQPVINKDGNSMVEFFIPMRENFNLELPAPAGKVGICFTSRPYSKQVKLLTTDPEEAKHGVYVQLRWVEDKLDQWGFQKTPLKGVIGYRIDQWGATPVYGDESDPECPF